jgi:hypothetical protein
MASAASHAHYRTRATVRGNFQGQLSGATFRGMLVRSIWDTGGRGGHNEIGFIRSIDLFAATEKPVLVTSTPYLLLEYRTSPTIKAHLNHPPLGIMFLFRFIYIFRCVVQQ